MTDSDQMLDLVASELAWLRPEPVFLGGATVALYLDAFGRSQVRRTEDVDLVVPSVVSRSAWWALEEELRARGWSPDLDGPICRYRSPGGMVVDLMSEDPSILGFASPWYRDVVARAENRLLSTGRAVRVPPPELLLACKLDAWRDRGRRDPYVSQDLEDVAALLDGCRELEARVASAEANLRRAIGEALSDIEQNHLETLLGHVPRSRDRRTQEARIQSLLLRLASGGV
jgi:hypothetical protein